MNDKMNLQNVPFTPGTPLVIPNREFTPEIQDQIVDNYFNMSGSVYDMATDLRRKNAYTQTQHGQLQTNEAPATGTAPQSGMSAAEIESLREVKAMIDKNPDILNQVVRQKLGYNQTPSNVSTQTQTTPSSNTGATTQPNQNETVPDDPWANFLNPQNEQTQTTQTQAQTGHDRAPSTNVQDAQAVEDSLVESLHVEAMRRGLDGEQVVQFLHSVLSNPSEALNLYQQTRSSGAGGTTQANNPQPQTRYRQAPTNLVDAPTTNTVSTGSRFTLGGNPARRKDKVWG